MRTHIFFVLLIFISCNKDTIDMSAIAAKGEILFISRRDLNSADWKIVRMNADGTGQTIVTNNLVTCAMPVISNDGQRIAFTAYENYRYSLYIINKDGKDLKQIAGSAQYCGNPGWSSDDDKIAYVKNNSINGGSYDIYVYEINSGTESKLTAQDNNFSPRFVSNGNCIIYTSAGNSFTGIYKMNIDGSNRRLLTPSNQSFGDPVISPDETKMAVTSLDWNGSQIFTMNIDGSNIKQLTFTVSPDYYDTGFPRDGNYNPVWSPDSKKLAYVSYENGSPDIFTINPNGIANKRLTNTPLRDEHPSWTKDGNYILFSSNRKMETGWEIYIMRTEGQLQTPLTNYTGDDAYPVCLN